MLRVSYLPGARCDFDESFDWYADQSTVAAERFADAIDAALARITGDSNSLPHVDRIHQECSVKRFPFRVVFRRLDNEILIVAIAHAKRRPDYWRARVE